MSEAAREEGRGGGEGGRKGGPWSPDLSLNVRFHVFTPSLFVFSLNVRLKTWCSREFVYLAGLWK
jgi:hypothetical protein